MNKKNETSHFSHTQTDLQLQEAAKILDNAKAENILLLDLKEIHSYLSHFIVATALSKMHLRKLSSDLIAYFKSHNLFLSNLPHEKEFESGWIILDGGSFMVHIFLQEKREYYALEELWGKAQKIEIQNLFVKQIPDG